MRRPHPSIGAVTVARRFRRGTAVGVHAGGQVSDGPDGGRITGVDAAQTGPEDVVGRGASPRSIGA
jgi:hypothetical protein